jgi:hypothetical protein
MRGRDADGVDHRRPWIHIAGGLSQEVERGGADDFDARVQRGPVQADADKTSSTSGHHRISCSRSSCMSTVFSRPLGNRCMYKNRNVPEFETALHRSTVHLMKGTLQTKPNLSVTRVHLTKEKSVRLAESVGLKPVHLGNLYGSVRVHCMNRQTPVFVRGGPALACGLSAVTLFQ